MNNKDLNLLRKHFDIIFRNDSNYKQKIYNNVNIKNNLFFEHYRISLIENSYKENDKSELKKTMNKIFPEFYELSKKKCIDDKYKELINLYNKKFIDKKFNLSYLNYKDIDIYKTMDGFYTISDEKEFIKKNKDTPFWFSSSYYAYKIVSSRGGGINAYKLKKNKNMKVLIINCSNIKTIINIVKQNLENKIKLRDKNVTKDYLLDLLRLSSCSEKGIVDQMKIYSKFNNYNKELWLTKEPTNFANKLCDLPVINNDYFGIIKSKGYHNYNFAYLLKYLNTNFFEDFFDGYIIINKYTPYYFNGITLEEIVLFDPYKIIQRNTKNNNDWYNYKDKLGFKIPPKLKLRNFLSEYNKNFNLYHLYNAKYNSNYNKSIIKNIKNKNSVLFLNCNLFKSININDTISDNINSTQKLIDFIQAKVVVLINSNNFKNKNKYYKEINKNKFKILYNNKDNITNKIIKNIDVLYIKQIKKYPKQRPTKENFKRIVEANLNNFKKKIINYENNDILYITDNYISNYSPELDILKKKKYIIINLKTSFTITDNYLAIKNFKIQDKYLLDFNKSYYKPILITI
jgi:hypothetical protein